jgi:predicted short-subunit dehydrogenase-like oxidoreductase (DUF2520 family)
MTISIIGSGNVAGVLAVSLVSAGHAIEYICSRNRSTGTKLASQVNADFINHPSKLPGTSDLNIVATDDSSIKDVITQLSITEKAVVHTSGATSINILSKFKNHGVLYPVNSITGNQRAFSPGTFFCIEATNSKLLRLLQNIATEVNGKPVKMNSEQRLAVHISAVFANNFVNALYQASYDILKSDKIHFKIIEPLLQTTANRALHQVPRKIQTGPAVRNDTVTLKKHLAFLKDHPELKDIYKKISALIAGQKKGS